MYIGKFEASGSKNSFYKLKGKKKGFKSFPTKNLAIFSHTIQTELSLDNLAPRVYSPVCKIRVPHYYIKSINAKKRKYEEVLELSNWGYLTEIATPYVCNDEYCSGDCSNDNECENNPEINGLLDDVYNCGIEYVDAHEGNFGYVKRGKKQKIVIIDLGRESVGDVSDFYPDVSCEEFMESEYA
jgi:hypothetical protein